MPLQRSSNHYLPLLLALGLLLAQPAAPSLATSVLPVSLPIVYPPSSPSQTNGAAEAHLKAFQQAYAAGDFSSALTAARRATEFDPARGKAAAARALGALQAWPRAQEVAESAFAEAPSIEHALLLAWALSNQDKNEGAIKILVQALPATATTSTTTQQANLSQELALLYLKAGKPEAALEIVSATSHSTIDDGVVGLVLAAQTGALERAVPLLQKALRSFSEQPTESARTTRSKGTRQSVVPRQVLHNELGTTLLALGRTREAATHLQQAYDQGPQTAALAYRLAGAYRSLDQRQRSAELLQEFQRLRDQEDQRDTQQRSVGSALNEAQEMAAANQLQGALGRVNQILSEHPLSFSAHGLRGKVLFSLGQKEAGLAAMRQATLLRPGVVEFQYLEGLFLRTMGRSEEARDALQRALALQPDLVEAHAILGGLLLELDEPSASLRHLDRAIALGANGAQIERARQLALEHLENGAP